MDGDISLTTGHGEVTQFNRMNTIRPIILRTRTLHTNRYKFFWDRYF